MNKYPIDKVAIRLVKEATDYTAAPLTTPQPIVEFIGKKIRDFDREVTCVINLKSSGELINYTFASIGAINQTISSPRELLKASILSNSANMILVHNHPSGNLSPSAEDCILTDKMIKLCDMVGIPLLDHIIVSPTTDSYFSFAEKDMITPEKYKNVRLADISFSIKKTQGIEMNNKPKL